MNKFYFILFFMSVFMFYQKNNCMETLVLKNFEKEVILRIMQDDHGIFMGGKVVLTVLLTPSILILIRKKILNILNEDDIGGIFNETDKFILRFLTIITIICSLTSKSSPKLFIKFCIDPFFEKYCEEIRNPEFYVTSIPIILAIVGNSIIAHSEILKDYKNFTPKLSDILKKNKEQELNTRQCIVCYDTPDSDENTINPCEFKDHIYCKKCLIDWINTIKNKQLLKCIICSQALIDNKKIELIYEKPNLKQKIKPFCRPIVVFNFIIITILLIELYASYSQF